MFFSVVFRAGGPEVADGDGAKNDSCQGITLHKFCINIILVPGNELSRPENWRPFR